MKLFRKNCIKEGKYNNKDLMEEENIEPSKPRWWYKFWLLSAILMIVSGIVSYFLIPTSLIIILFSEFIGFIGLGTAYYIRVRPSIRVNKAIYIVFGITSIGFIFSVIFVFSGLPRFFLTILGSWGSWLSLAFIIILCIIGAFIGNWIGKKRDYQLPLSLKNKR